MILTVLSVQIAHAAPRSACSTAGSSPEKLMEAVFSALKLRTFSANFCQLYVDRVLGARPKECGELLAHPDGRVRFSYLTPSPKTFVFDGKRALFAEPEAAQVTYVDGFRASPLAQAMAVLWGQGNWRKVFELRGPIRKGATSNERLVTLVPIEARKQVEQIVVTVDVARCEVKKSELTDTLGNTTTYFITARKLDVVIPADAFVYEVPATFHVLHAADL